MLLTILFLFLGANLVDLSFINPKGYQIWSAGDKTVISPTYRNLDSLLDWIPESGDKQSYQVYEIRKAKIHNFPEI